MTLLDSTRVEGQSPSEEWGHQFVPSVAKGINAALASMLIDNQELQVAKNIRFDKDQALVDLGYVTFGQVLRGKPRASFQFFLKNGSSIPVCITNSTFYRWNSTILEWQYVSDGTSTAATNAIRASALNLLTQTEALDNAAWSVTGTMTRTADTTVAPDTLTTADTLDDTDAGVASYISQTVDISTISGFNTSYIVFSCYGKAGTNVIGGFEIDLTGGTTAQSAKIAVNLSTGAFSSFGFISFDITNEGSGWYRIWGRILNNGSGNNTVKLSILPAPAASLTTTWTPATTGTNIFWGAQIETFTTAEAASTYEPVDDPINIIVDSITGFSSGDNIGIALTNGNQHRTTINGAPSGSTIVLTDPLLSNVSAAGAVVKAVELTGSDDIPISLITWAAFDKLYFTNGVDAPMEFDGTSVAEILNLPGTTFKCRVIQIFKNHLILLNTEEDGTAYPQRARWSEPGSDSNFNDSVNFLDLYDSEDWIVASEPLGDFLTVYKERSIYRVEFLGLADQDFQFTRTIDAEGALNQDSVINLGDEHIFMGNANIYTYDGGFSLTPVGDNIFDKIFASSGELNNEFAHKSFGVYVEELDEAWWFYPAGTDEYPMNTIRYKVASGAWSIREYPIQVVGFGFFQTAADLTWQTIGGTWESQLFAWVSKISQSDAPTVHLCSGSDNRVYEYNYVASDDNGTAIDYEMVTKDFYIPNWDLRFDRYEFFLSGTNIKIEASYDFGESWATLKSAASPGTVFQRVRAWKQRVGRSIRFRFSGSNQFALGWLNFSYKMENILEP